MKLALSCCFFLGFIWTIECIDRQRNKACYQAKICMHNNKEKCGVNSKGSFRRFLDSCDIMEYNCLRETDYAKTSPEHCSKLPPMKDAVNVQSNSDEQLNGPEPKATGEANDEEDNQGDLSEHKFYEDDARTNKTKLVYYGSVFSHVHTRIPVAVPLKQDNQANKTKLLSGLLNKPWHTRIPIHPRGHEQWMPLKQDNRANRTKLLSGLLNKPWHTRIPIHPRGHEQWMPLKQDNRANRTKLLSGLLNKPWYTRIPIHPREQWMPLKQDNRANRTKLQLYIDYSHNFDPDMEYHPQPGHIHVG